MRRPSRTKTQLGQVTEAPCRSDGEVEPETLTSNLRALMAIRSFRWKMSPPDNASTAATRLELPVVKMEILDFVIKTGNSAWPTYAEHTVDVGRGSHDGGVQRVLRKWYFGE